jgi:hypothetical protein
MFSQSFSLKSNSYVQQTDRHTDGQTDGNMHVWTDKQTETYKVLQRFRYVKLGFIKFYHARDQTQDLLVHTNYSTAELQRLHCKQSNINVSSKILTQINTSAHKATEASTREKKLL